MGSRFTQLLFVVLAVLGVAYASSAQTKTIIVENISNTGCVIEGRSNRPIPKMISGGILNGKAILPQPRFGFQKGGHGRVSVQIIIGHNGFVIEASGVSGPESLKSIAAKAALQARFSPTLLNAQPVKVSGVIWYRY